MEGLAETLFLIRILLPIEDLDTLLHEDELSVWDLLVLATVLGIVSSK